MSCYWWLSFADPARPKGTRFLGALIIGPAADLKEAIQTAWILGLNPGGEVQGEIIPRPVFEATPQDYRGRLLTRADAEALDTYWFAMNIGANDPAP